MWNVMIILYVTKGSMLGSDRCYDTLQWNIVWRWFKFNDTCGKYHYGDGINYRIAKRSIILSGKYIFNDDIRIFDRYGIVIIYIMLKVLLSHSKIRCKNENGIRKNVYIKNPIWFTIHITQTQCKKLHAQVFETSALLFEGSSSCFSKYLQNRTDKK